MTAYRPTVYITNLLSNSWIEVGVRKLLLDLVLKPPIGSNPGNAGVLGGTRTTIPLIIPRISPSLVRTMEPESPASEKATLLSR